MAGAVAGAVCGAADERPAAVEPTGVGESGRAGNFRAVMAPSAYDVDGIVGFDGFGGGRIPRTGRVAGGIAVKRFVTRAVGDPGARDDIGGDFELVRWNRIENQFHSVQRPGRLWNQIQQNKRLSVLY